MPIYEYVCDKCGEKFDALRSMKDSDKEIECTRCHSLQTHRALSLCFAHSDGREVSSSASGGCSGCSGGSCSSCGH